MAPLLPWSRAVWVNCNVWVGGSRPSQDAFGEVLNKSRGAAAATDTHYAKPAQPKRAAVGVEGRDVRLSRTCSVWIPEARAHRGGLGGAAARRRRGHDVSSRLEKAINAESRVYNSLYNYIQELYTNIKKILT